jgi:hypothetical protein
MYYCTENMHIHLLERKKYLSKIYFLLVLQYLRIVNLDSYKIIFDLLSKILCNIHYFLNIVFYIYTLINNIAFSKQIF